MRLVLNERTEAQLKKIAANPPHAVLVVGSKGIGKRTAAEYLIKEALKIDSIESYPYGKIITSQDNKAIGIEAVRELEHFLSLKVPGNAFNNRFVFFENAHMLTTEAQNALLKTLEEPPEGSMIVMTVTREQALLPTIRSRTQTIKIHMPDIKELKQLFIDSGYKQSDIDKTASIGGGLPGLMTTMLTDPDHPLVAATDYARRILSKPPYERLLLVDELSKDKQICQNLSFILQQMARISLQKAEGPATRRWQKILQAAYNCSENLSNSAQPKLALTDLMISI